MNANRIQLLLMLLLIACIIVCLLIISKSQDIFLTELGKGLLLIFSVAALNISLNKNLIIKK
ncbi:hypothetical protein C9994_02465 [Marivirga lumbricoides]|uniref:Uncharacterized protein n=1 Tax=Marivirga lumbricoides TaxID=1046115 RepID=A0A2T4DUX8_9BACT|nr:hypothetical protein C9994_02465 [Marivirga lumbricoides]